MGKNTKKRNWAFVLYPESAPDNWREELQKTGLQCAISPLHDGDINADRTLKKEHYHIILAYNGPTSYNVVKALTDKLKQPVPQALEQIRGYYRYFTHKDNPEKAQYKESDIEVINGFDISDFVEITHSEVIQTKKKLQTLIREKQMTEYAELIDFLLDESMDIEYEVASCNTYFFDKYIESRRYILQQDYKEPHKTAPKNHTKNRIKNRTKNHCPNCGSIDIKKDGKDCNHRQRWKCKDCGKRFQ